VAHETDVVKRMYHRGSSLNAVLAWSCIDTLGISTCGPQRRPWPRAGLLWSPGPHGQGGGACGHTCQGVANLADPQLVGVNSPSLCIKDTVSRQVCGKLLGRSSQYHDNGCRGCV
jgi:hypothetical protein